MYMLTCTHNMSNYGLVCKKLGNKNIGLLNNKKLSYCWETVRRESMPRIS